MTTKTKILLALVVAVFVAGIIYLTYYVTARQVTKADFPLLPSSTTTGISTPERTTDQTVSEPKQGELTLQLSAGFNLVSFGHRLAPSDCENVFPNKEVFALIQGKWASCAESKWPVAPGKGYFVNSKNGENLKIVAQATAVPTTERQTSTLDKGWNALGNPYPKQFKLDSTKLEVQFDDKTMTLKAAIDSKFVSPLHRFNPLSRAFEEIKDGDMLQGNQGFVIQSAAKGTLTFPGPGA